MKPMLAKKYNEHKKKVKSPFYVQPKLNGIRMLAYGGVLQSRDQHTWGDGRLEHIRTALRFGSENLVLDGELYRHGWSLQKINGTAAVNRLQDDQYTSGVSYHVFDCLVTDAPEMPFGRRMEVLRQEAESWGDGVELVETYHISDMGQAEELYSIFKAEGFEGMMYRLDKPYGIETQSTNKENRWDILLKRKDWLDEDCEIVDVSVGTGQFSECCGSLVCRLPGNGVTFNAGSGLSHLQRRAFWENPPIGKVAKIKYEMLSDEGIPLKPTIEAVLD